MDITHEIHEGHARLALVGRFDATWSESVAEVLGECIRAGAHVVRLDLAGVVFLSSAGLRVLLGAYRDLSRIGGSLAVTHASEPVHTVLTMSGLSALLQLQVAETPGESAEPATPDAPVRLFECAGARIEQWDLDRRATMRLRIVGDPASVFEGRSTGLPAERLSFPKSALGLGIAAFGRDASDCLGRFGEFLAIGGAAICHADVEGALPDWMVAEGRMFPEAEMLWGLAGEGGFATQLRFEAAESETGVLRLSEALEIALDAADSAPIAVVMVAETAQLVGAALRTVEGADANGNSLFAFPRIRDHLLFTAEPAWTNSLALVVGVVAKQVPPALAPLLRPIVADGSRIGHIHAAVFPYRPVRKGCLDLDSTIGGLFEDRSVRALLHLVNDWREPVGAGESAFTRGVLWISPLEVA
jgi:anti-anti-sigma factor